MQPLCYALLGRHAEYDSRYGEADGKEHRNQAHDQPEGVGEYGVIRNTTAFEIR